MTTIIYADERAMLAHTRPNAFDELRDSGKLGVGMWTTPVEVKALAARRWAAGDALRRLHAAGWINQGGAAANPLDGIHAAAARARLADLEQHIGLASWPLVLRVVIAGDSIRECHDLLPFRAPGTHRAGDDVLLDRLCLALDRIESMFSTKES